VLRSVLDHPPRRTLRTSPEARERTKLNTELDELLRREAGQRWKAGRDDIEYVLDADDPREVDRRSL